MKFILAKKGEMTQKYANDGSVIPVTKLLVKPCVVTQIKRKERDGYWAIQIGCGSKKNISKPVKGHLKNLGNLAYLKEFEIPEAQAAMFKVGDVISVGNFQPGEAVKVSGWSKGKGFQGVVKRHGFAGHPATHGHKDQLRMPGSIGATGPQHVLKGKRMAGRMGGGQVTINNLTVVAIDPQKEEIFIKGAIPGAKGGLVLIKGEGDLELNLKPVQGETEGQSQKDLPAYAKSSDKVAEEKKESEKKIEEGVKE